MSRLKKFKDKRGQSYPHLYQDEVTKTFWAVIRVGDKVKKKSLLTTEYLHAISKLPIALADLGDTSKETLKKADQARDVKLLKDFWSDLRKKKVADDTAESTLYRMDSVWRNNLEPYFGNWTAADVNPNILPDFVLWHRKHKPDRQLVNVYKYLGNLLHDMVRVGAIAPQQVPEIRVPKSEKKHHDKKKGRIITDEERERLLACGSDRMRLISGLGDILGMRKMEIVALERDRIVKDSSSYFIELTEDDTKTGLPRILPVPKHLEARLKDQLAASADSKFLFPTKDLSTHVASQVIDRDWVEQKRLAKIKGRLKFHDWRHTRATKMAKANVNPIVACTILGMTIAIYQKKYLQLTGRDLVATIDLIVDLEGKK